MKKKDKNLKAQSEQVLYAQAEPSAEELEAAEKEKDRQRLRKKVRHKRCWWSAVPAWGWSISF